MPVVPIILLFTVTFHQNIKGADFSPPRVPETAVTNFDADYIVENDIWLNGYFRNGKAGTELADHRPFPILGSI